VGFGGEWREERGATGKITISDGEKKYSKLEIQEKEYLDIEKISVTESEDAGPVETGNIFGTGIVTRYKVA